MVIGLIISNKVNVNKTFYSSLSLRNSKTASQRSNRRRDQGKDWVHPEIRTLQEEKGEQFRVKRR